MGCCFSCFKSDSRDPTKAALIDSEGKKIEEMDTATENTTSVQPHPICLEDFKIERVLGKGAFGKVFLVTKKDNGKFFAMKCLRKDMIKQRNQKEHTTTEREILGDVDSPFIVQLRYAFQTPERLYMVMDFINGGELFFHLRSSSRFSEQRARFYAAEVLLALEYIHGLGIIYRDLKPENILLDSEGHIKLTDFGLSKQFFDEEPNGENKTFSVCGTPEYLAPEILRQTGHDKAVDFWSFGALLYEMLSGAPPFYSKNRDQMFRNILTRPVEMKSHFSWQVVDLLKKLLQVDPRKRLSSIDALKQHQFFEGMDWVKLANKEIPVPFKPKVTGPRDLRNFDRVFTDETPEESPISSNFNSRRTSSNRYDGFTYHDSGNI
ncbi:unnamed protein product [Blepharisma stoltei]|uniref:non-specific serine/threonine protein kinase n=1 Tax=Blepharisma stoltei TaxID=1481888 RepID=A0AAU9JVZ1_9CILI|nr:unnamed protein product [Blepharisma stoltei]